MDLSNISPFDWMMFSLAAAAAAIAYLAWSRRKLTVWHASARLITAGPTEQLEIAVSHRGQPVEQPVYMVHIQMKCAGNRDIAMAAEREFIEIETADGVEILAINYGPQKIKLDTLEASNRISKFRFDLLKRGQTLVFNIYVKSARDLGNASLAKQLPVSVQVRDVKTVVLATNRYELWGGGLSALGLFGFIGGFYLVQSFAPIDQTELLLDDAGKRVALRSITESNALKVCEATTSVWDEAPCHERSVSDVASFTPAPKADANLYVSGAPIWSRGLSLLVVLFGVAMFGFGPEIARGMGRITDRFFARRLPPV